jgi:thymidylate synthase
MKEEKCSITPQKILVFQQYGSGEGKIAGVKKHGDDLFQIKVISIDRPLPEIIDEGEGYLPDSFTADLVLDFLEHPDLSHDLHMRCEELGIPVIASGKKAGSRWPATPPT